MISDKLLGKSAADRQAETDRFFRHVLHDLRASVRALRVLPDWIAEDLGAARMTPPEAVREHLAMMRSQGHRLDAILLGLQDFMNAGAPQPSVLCDLDDVAAEAASGLRRSAAFRIESDFAVPDVLVPRADILRLFSILMDNAMRHHDRGHGSISLESRAIGDNLEIVVSDDGPGIPAAAQDRLFDALVTLQPRDTCNTAGMGLAIARRIVTRLGGSIRLVPVEDRGACFVITLPASCRSSA